MTGCRYGLLYWSWLHLGSSPSHQYTEVRTVEVQLDLSNAGVVSSWVRLAVVVVVSVAKLLRIDQMLKE